MKQCKNCGTPFTPKHGKAIHCSDSCRRVHASRRYRAKNQEVINERQVEWRKNNRDMYLAQKMRERERLLNPPKVRIEEAKAAIASVKHLPMEDRKELAQELLHDHCICFFSSYVEDFVSETLEPELY